MKIILIIFMAIFLACLSSCTGTPTKESGINRPFTVAILSDPHVFAPEHAGVDLDAFRELQKKRGHVRAAARFVRVIEQVNMHKPDLVFITGDMVDFLSEENVPLFLKIKSNLTGDVHLVMGNHDRMPLSVGRIKKKPYGVFSLAKDEDVHRVWGKAFGGDRFYYSLEKGGFKFIVCDNSRGRLGRDQLAWLKRELASAPAAGTFVFNHIPYRTSETEESLRILLDEKRGIKIATKVPALGRALVKLLSSITPQHTIIPTTDPSVRALERSASKIVAVFSGHMHRKTDDIEIGVRQVVLPEPHIGFLILKLDPESGKVEFLNPQPE